MVRHHEKKKKKAQFSKKKQKELEAEDLDRFAGSSEEDESEGEGEVEVEEEKEIEIKKSSKILIKAAKTQEKRKVDAQDENNIVKKTKSVEKENSRQENDINGEKEDNDDIGNDNDTESSEEGDSDEEMTSDSSISKEFDQNSESEEEGQPITKDSGMANVMSRILYNHNNQKDKTTSTPSSTIVVKNTRNGITRKTTPILSKTITPLQKKLMKTKKEESRLKLKRKQLRKEHLSYMHVPQLNDIDEIEKERQYRRVATRGVVALFNAISKHQQKISTTAITGHNNTVGHGDGGSSKKEDGKENSVVTKRKFLDMLKQTALEGSATTNEVVDTGENEKAIVISQNHEQEHSQLSKGKGWKALQDDYLTGSTLKDWDKELSDDESDRGEAAVTMVDNDDF